MNNRPEAEEGKPIRASFDTEVKASEGEDRSLNFTISSARVDRSGDTINQDGWNLDNYRKNPVVLWAHDASMLPVGRATSIEIAGGKLKAVTEFTPKGMSRFNDTVYEMYRAGFLNATSVGFVPIKFNYAEDATRKFGIDFLEQELLEFSAVPVPANADALIEARSAGIDLAPMLGYHLDHLLRSCDHAFEIMTKLLDNNELKAAAELIIEAGQPKPEADILDIGAVNRAAYARRKRQRELDLIRIRGTR